MEIDTVSKVLSSQIVNILNKMNFRVTLRQRNRKNSNVNIYTIGLNGWRMIKKWYDEIGFTNPNKENKAKSILGEKNLN